MEVEEREDQPLQDLGGGAEERDGAVRGGEFAGFLGFGDGDDVGVFPDGWNAATIEGMIDEMGEEGEAPRAQMLEVPNC